MYKLFAVALLIVGTQMLALVGTPEIDPLRLVAQSR
jgi:hypothetical protein